MTSGQKPSYVGGQRRQRFEIVLASDGEYLGVCEHSVDLSHDGWDIVCICEVEDAALAQFLREAFIAVRGPHLGEFCGE
nr:hypothetical protein [Microbacterium natoriense]